LFFDIAKIIKKRRPAAFLLENVKNLRSHDKGNTFRVIQNVLENELNYKIFSKVIDAKGFVPQHRERIYIVGFRDDVPFDWNDFNKYFFPATPSYKPVSGQVLAKYLACATFENGDEKQAVIRILSTNSQGFTAAKNLLMKTIFAEEKSCVKLLKNIVNDLKTMSTEEVAAKSYPFIFNQFYWTNRKYVPDDPHWQIIDLLNSAT
jgi:DNA-cytosine methyltransferase